jgi:hypothetical protein
MPHISQTSFDNLGVAIRYSNKCYGFDNACLIVVKTANLFHVAVPVTGSDRT